MLLKVHHRCTAMPGTIIEVKEIIPPIRDLSQDPGQTMNVGINLTSTPAQNHWTWRYASEHGMSHYPIMALYCRGINNLASSYSSMDQETEAEELPLYDRTAFYNAGTRPAVQFCSKCHRKHQFGEDVAVRLSVPFRLHAAKCREGFNLVRNLRISGRFPANAHLIPLTGLPADT